MTKKPTHATLSANQRKYLHRAGIFTAVATIISSVPIVAATLAADLIPTKYLFIIVPIYLIAVGFTAWHLFTKPTRLSRAIIFITLGVIITGINAYAFSSLRATGDFFSGIQQPNVRYVDYVVIAKNNANVSLDNAQSVSIITTDSLYKAAADGLKKETKAAQQSAMSMSHLTEALNTGTTELAALRKANYDALEEDYAAFYNSTVVLATYKVRDVSAIMPTADTTKPFVLYISGIDTYGDVSEVSRSDVNILAVINPQKHELLLVNTPRDYYVQLHNKPGIPDKLTHAGIYGIDTSRQTLEDLYHTEIPYYLRLNFTSLVKTIDVIGPITVTSDYAFKSFRVGENTLDSKRALEFARERYSFTDGDRQRGRNQQKVIEAIIAKLSEPKNAIRYNKILANLQGSLQTNMSQPRINALAKTQLDDMKHWKVESISVDGTGATQQTYSMGAQPLYVMIPDESSVKYARQMIDKYLESTTK